MPKTILSNESKGKMETRLYIGNMSHETSEQDLRTMFTEAGTVAAVDLIMDRQTGKPKGFAFVTMSSLDEAEKAISLFDTKDVTFTPAQGQYCQAAGRTAIRERKPTPKLRRSNQKKRSCLPYQNDKRRAMKRLGVLYPGKWNY